MDEKKKILLCEDDENLGMLLREYLNAKGFDTTLCADGEAGYQAFIDNKFDLCVFDVMMPRKDGFTLAKEVKQENKDIPVIFLTARNMKEDVYLGFELGADDYVVKPFDTKEIVARIKAVLRRSASSTVKVKVFSPSQATSLFSKIFFSTTFTRFTNTFIIGAFCHTFTGGNITGTIFIRVTAIPITYAIIFNHISFLSRTFIFDIIST